MRLVQIARARATAPGDAIGTDLRLVREYIESGRHPVFREATELYELNDAGSMRNHPAFFLPGNRDIVLLHYSIDLDHLEEVLSWSVPVILMYHNITPAAFLQPYDLLLAGKLERARLDLDRYLYRFRAFFAASAFSAAELNRRGASPVEVRPVVFPWPQTDPTIPRQRGLVLFVGRLFPNKNHIDLIKAFYYIQKIIPEARLVCLGSILLDSYFEELEALIHRLQLEAVVRLQGAVSTEELGRAYSRAELFLTCSLHEGFAVPLLEAMAAGVPVLANGLAPPHAEKGAGVIYHDQDPAAIAEIALRLLLDQELRSSVIEAQNQVVKKHSNDGIIHGFLSKILQHV